MKRGDHYNCECPWCGQVNHYVASGLKLEVSRLETCTFTRPCDHCKQAVQYHARLEMRLTAERVLHNPNDP